MCVCTRPRPEQRLVGTRVFEERETNCMEYRTRMFLSRMQFSLLGGAGTSRRAWMLMVERIAVLGQGQHATRGFVSSQTGRQQRIQNYYIKQHCGRNDSPTIIGHRFQSTSTSAASNQTTSTATTSLHSDIQHQPPFPVQIALVGATTAIATPVFPAIGFVNLFLRVTLPDAQSRATLSTTLGSVLSFATWTLVPAFYQFAPIILPCAIGNGIVAGTSFAAIHGITKAMNKPEWLYKNPLAGGVIGATTGFVAPYFVYGPCYQAMYDISGITESTRMLMAFPLATQVIIATGFVAGTALYPMLYYPMNGVPGLNWLNFSAPALLAISLALCYVYTPDDLSIPLPDGVYVDPKLVPLLDAIPRYNITTGEIQLYSMSSDTWIPNTKNSEIDDVLLQGQELANRVRNNNTNNSQAFDDRVVAFLNSYTFLDGATKYPNRTIFVPPAIEIQEKQEEMLTADGIVAYIAKRRRKEIRKGSDDDNDDAAADVDTRIMEIIKKMDGINNDKQQQRNPTTRRLEKLHNIEALSIAVELLMVLKEKNRQQQQDSSSSKMIDDLEYYIKRHSPHPITLYNSDNEGSSSASVESQLETMKICVGDMTDDMKSLIKSWEHIHQSDQYERRKNIAIQTTGAIVLSLVGLFLFQR